jgi:Peptidase family S64
MLSRRLVCGLVGMIAFTAGWGIADGGQAHQTKQTKPIQLGTSGGNVNDKTRAYCCSGTLGALVTKGGSGPQYILSNNHVLGRLSKAAIGEDVSQPGLIDNNCRVYQTVADFSEAPAFGSKNVDAAIAQVQSGAVDLQGSIIDIGAISSTVATPVPNLPVMKSGRTTGFTTGMISSFADVNVQYQNGCGSGKKFVVSYSDQIVIEGSGFSAGGDSGSLIISNDGSSCKQPVGLLFAGSSTTTIANPIADVINAFSPKLSFVGSSTTTSCPVSGTAISAATYGPSQAALEHARTIKERHKPSILPRANVLGIGVGAADDNPSEAVIVIYTETGRGSSEALPEYLDGLRVKVVNTEPFVAYGNQKWGDNRCSGE